jgi:aminoglycoside 3-N-acetyltransferase
MANLSVINKIFEISPIIEVILRKLYWSNIGHIEKIKKKLNRKKKPAHENKSVDFEKILKIIEEKKSKECNLLLVHSSFSPLRGTGLPPTEIISKLLGLVGKAGTLAMPAMPKFRNSANKLNYLNQDQNFVFEYDVKKSLIKTGLLPTYLHRKNGSVRSAHPINTMVAYGAIAKELMADNLSGDSPLACGKNSSWKKCIDNNACIIGLGLDLTHSLTMIHVAEDILDENWPIKNWYKETSFIIKQDGIKKNIKLRERDPKWGALHFAERTLCKDLVEQGILFSTVIDGVMVEIINSQELIDFLNSKNKMGYPYFGIKQ